jgi:transcriptional regulator with XRE-family HTH domain
VNAIDDTAAARVRFYREGFGWSQSQLASKLRERGLATISQSTVWAIEKGQRRLRLSEAVEIAETFGVTLAVLLDDATSEDARNLAVENVRLLKALGQVAIIARDALGSEDFSVKLRGVSTQVTSTNPYGVVQRGESS